ncbi:nitrate- and nitrite sensing domain-containing protein [Streptomyces sp. SHP 1-2]|uniref:nitrate- and nitrite sensing domain-containing protein n=1 Tax=Streptomyces sp. SHP 1-2 TaxID=2769489 RepID=UPI002240E65E|nr:nitrate- and nitrite sensing domain-containing protein [Streptomyces sp. SHP 1-2]
MRAPVQKTRPRRRDKQTAPAESAERTPGTSAPGAPATPPAPPAPAVGKGRATHVRNRLIVAVAVVAAAVAGAGAPSIVAASGQLHDTQELVTLAGRTQDALTLAHSLADERDEVTPYIAAGRPRSKAPSEQRGARVDRQVEEMRADPATPAALREDLEAIATLRRAALTGKSTALEAHEEYTRTITELHSLATELAERMPPRAGSGAHALAELDTAVQQAAATRGLLLAALGVPSSTQTVIDPLTGLPTESTVTSDADTERRDALTTAAQQARVRSDASLTAFREGAPRESRDRYDAAVTGPEVNSAEKYLAGLTDRPVLSDEELRTSVKRLDAALSARIDAMRGAESALYEKRTAGLEQLRDDDVTGLELRIAALGALILLALGVATAMARTLTRPLSVLRRGSARLAAAEQPAAEQPIAFTGRNDEFAQVVRSVNALHAHAATLAERVVTLESDRKHLVGQRQRMADAREELRSELAESTARLETVRKSIGGTFVNLALRTLGLVERQLAVIESLEQREQDPDRLSTLFKLDHFATVMRRHSENLLVLAGTEHIQHSSGPVPLVDVVRAAVSEIERYERVRIAALPPRAHVAGFAADDLSHLLAELMENATSFSPPDLPAEISGWLLESGEVMLSVQDEGIGMTAERLERLNARLTDFDPEAPYEQDEEDGLGLGLYVVARLAHRHGVRVRLREQKQGGIAAVVVLPTTLLAGEPPAAVAPSAAPGGEEPGTVSLPGADSEANSNALPERAPRGSAKTPTVPAARSAEPDTATEAATDAATGTATEGARFPAGGEADAPARDEAGGETPTPDVPGRDAPTPDTPTPDAPNPVASNAEVPGAPAPGADAPAPDTSGTDAPDLDAPHLHVPNPDVPGSDAPGPDVPGSDAAVSERQGASSPGEDTEGSAPPAAPGPSDAVSSVPAPGPGPDTAPAGDSAAPGTEGAETTTTSETTTSETTTSETTAPSETSGGTRPGAGATAVPDTATVDGAPDTPEPAPLAGAPRTPAAPNASADPSAAPGTPLADRAPAAGEAPGTPQAGIPWTSATGTAPQAPADPAAPETPESSAAPRTPAPRSGSAAAGDTPVGDTPDRDAPAAAAAPVARGRRELPDDTTMALLLPAQAQTPADDPYAIGPDAHERTPDEATDQQAEPVTEKGLPKRTPKLTTPTPAERPRTGSVDAEALRRRLGGFRRGAEAGRRDVEAEIADRTAGHRSPAAAGTTEEATGGTVEEASS